ncbi:MAG TPA: lysozyme inhibitor LprI family protein [Streptosporangiaceae bacterium]
MTPRIVIAALATPLASMLLLASVATGTATASASAAATQVGSVKFVPIVELFDPGHAARAAKNPGNCAKKQTTLGIEFCFDTQTENIDAKIDAAQLAKFNRSGTAGRNSINARDRAWFANRLHVCEAVYHSGGTIDGINISGCQFDVSTARLYAVTGKAAPRATLGQTDSTSLSQLSYFTTAGGTRIATIDTQGDETGGEVLAWVIIGGYQGFTVNTAQFIYKDGSFTDRGILQRPNPQWHHVKPGAIYQFSIDYSTISRDPHAAKGTGGYVYAPAGKVLADWSGR